jgi:putative ABC transport system ATP-binding protein
MAEEPTAAAMPGASTGVTASVGAALIDLQGVSRSFRDGRGERHVLRGVDLLVQPGELIALMGPSGSGKSTLLAIAGGLDHADAGQVVVAGQHLRSLGTRALAELRRHHVGYVEQHLNLLAALTAAENVSLPLELDGMKPGPARAAALEALGDVGMAELADTMPEQLSGGEQQRVAIARGLIGERRIVLADEPTGALDSLTGESVMRLLRQRCDERGDAVVMATHNAANAAWADRVLHLRDGELVDRASVGGVRP